jgi:hypothetical protein
MDILYRLYIDHNEYTVIRIAFETLELFPEDEPLCAELRQMIDDSRRGWTRRLREIYDILQSDSDAINRGDYAEFWRLDHTVFQQRGLELMRDGFPVQELQRWIGSPPLSFDAEESSHFDFPLAGIRDREELQKLDAISFFLILLNEVCACVSNPAYYASKQQFDRDVLQKCVAFEYLLREAAHWIHSR